MQGGGFTSVSPIKVNQLPRAVLLQLWCAHEAPGPCEKAVLNLVKEEPEILHFSCVPMATGDAALQHPGPQCASYDKVLEDLPL